MGDDGDDDDALDRGAASALAEDVDALRLARDDDDGANDEGDDGDDATNEDGVAS